MLNLLEIRLHDSIGGARRDRPCQGRHEADAKRRDAKVRRRSAGQRERTKHVDGPLGAGLGSFEEQPSDESHRHADQHRCGGVEPTDCVRPQHRRRVDVVDRDVEEALDLVGVQVHRQEALDADRLEHVGDDLGADRHARRARPAVLARVAEVRDHRGHPARRRALERVDHDAELHQVLVRRRARRLEDEDVAGADVLLDLDVDFAVREAADLGFAEADRQVRGDVLRERGIRVAGEENGVEEHDNSEGGDSANLAGEEGFEPSHVGIKIRCLNQLGDSPTPVPGSRRSP